jgi:putative spermidine/putrescine transport system permease protein
VTGVRPGRVALVVVCVLTGVWLVLPTLATVPLSFTSVRSFALPPEGFSTRWYSNFFSDDRWIAALSNSLIVAALAMVLATVAGTLAALALDRSRSRARGLFEALLLMPAIVPFILLGLAIYYVFLRWHLSGTIAGLVLAHSVIGIPLVVRPVLASLSAHDRRLEQAAANLGASPAATLLQVTLPSIRSGVLAGAVFAFVGSFDEVVISIFLCSADVQTLPVLMFNAVTRELDPTIAAASTLILVFTTTLILIGLRIGGKEAATRAF